jgi:hypothetical protein
MKLKFVYNNSSQSFQLCVDSMLTPRDISINISRAVHRTDESKIEKHHFYRAGVINYTGERITLFFAP